jgi:PilZ domain-containing protein
MRNYTCTGCNSAFHTAVTGLSIKCPYCGLAVKGLEDRLEGRGALRRVCRIIRGGSGISAETTDISRKGAGVILDGPIERDDTVRVEIRDLDLESNARVVWVEARDAGKWRAGLSFL